MRVRIEDSKKIKQNVKLYVFAIIIVILLIISFKYGIQETVFHNTNEIFSTFSSVVQAICIVVQSIIIYKQLKLDEKINQKSIEQEKGIFVLEQTNIYTDMPSYNKYNLKDNLRFRNIGNGHVILKGQKISLINNTEYAKGTFFTNLEEYSKLDINLNLSLNQLSKSLIEVNVELLLQNLNGYEYTEIMEIVFIKENEDGYIYNLQKFNVKLDDDKIM